MKISFTVFGKPEPQGSTRAFLPKGWKRPVITTDNAKLKPWRQELVRAAMAAVAENGGEVTAREDPVHVRMIFYLKRPHSLAKRFTNHTKKPDWDKLARAVCDSLTGSVLVDDSQICEAIVSKRYGSPERVEITVCTDEKQFHEEKSVNETMELFA